MSFPLEDNGLAGQSSLPVYEDQRYNTFFSAPTLVTGGTFTQHSTSVTNYTSGIKGGFERLQDEVAATAFHNSAQRVDPPKCHPNTRDAVLRHITQWIKASENRKSYILWLNGAAGAGKSAIAQTIAEMCEKEGLQLASFFFFRTDPTRNTPKSLMATLSYQLAQTLPSTRDIIAKVIESDPLIFQRSLQFQLEYLIARPLRQLRKTQSISNPSPFLVIIDGIDECEQRAIQIDVLTTISNALRTQTIPAIFMLASRNESQLTMMFNSKNMADLLTRIALDDEYLSDDDIFLFLNEKITEIKETHPLRHLIPDPWPSPQDVQELVEKSSGQFIYASVVIKFISAPNSLPVQRLEVVRGLRPVRLDTPFAQLDALYQHIFSSVHDIENTLPVLAYSVLMRHTDIPMITNFLGLSSGSVEIALADLSSVIACKDGYVIYLHASLPDFLLDEARSQKYHISPTKWHTDFAHRWFTLQAQSGANQVDNSGWIADITKHLRLAAPTAQLYEDLLDHRPAPGHFGIFPSIEKMTDFLDAIKDLNFDDRQRVYRRQLNLVTRLIYSTNPDDMLVLSQKHDIRKIVARIKFEGKMKRIARKVTNTVAIICFPITCCVGCLGIACGVFYSKI